jgi:hypothetical protein
MRIHLFCCFVLPIRGRFCVYVACTLFWFISCSIRGHSVCLLIEQTTIKGEVRTSENTVPPSAMVVVLKHKKDEKACETCEAKVKSDGTYTIETSLPPGPYTLMAYDGKQYSKDDQSKELKRGLNDNIDFTLKSPSAHVTRHGPATDAQGALYQSGSMILYLAGCRVCEIDRVTLNEEGEYVFTDLPAPEKYVVALKVGEHVFGYSSLDVDDKPDERIALAFQPAPLSEVVSIGADPLQVSDDAAINIDSLPVTGRSFTLLISVGPGTQSTNPSSAVGSSINGLQSRQITFTIDGIDNKDTLASSRESPVGLNAAGEFRFSQTGYQNAQLSNSSDLQIDMSFMSGTNEFHGGADYQLMNDALDGRSFFSLPGFDIFRRHSGSAKLGGPIWKKRELFFFSSYELDRKAEAPVFSTVLASHISALNQQLGRLGLPSENLRRFVTTSTSDSSLSHLDYNINKNNSLSVIYGVRRDRIRNDLTSALDGTSSTPSTARHVSGRDHFFTWRYNWVLSPNLVNEASYSYRSNSISVVPVEPKQPSMLITGIALLGRATSLIEGDGHRHDSHVISEKITIASGKHRMDVGGQFDFSRNLFRFAAFESGRVIVPGLAALSSTVPVADLFQIGRGGSQVRFNVYKIVAYFQDDIKVKPNFSVSLGLRYKAELPPSTQQRDLKGFQPKVSFSWDISGNQATILRAGYGLYRSFWPSLPLGFQLLMGGEGLQSMVSARRVTSIVGQQAATSAFNQFLASGNIPTGPQLATIYDPASTSPIVHAFDLSFARGLGRRIALDVSYSYRRGSNLLTATNVNLPSPIIINGRSDFRNASVNPSFAQIYRFETTGHSSYHGGSLRVFREFSHGLGFNAGYTFSKAIDDVPFLRNVDLMPSHSFEATPENVFDRRNERAVSEWNPAHRLKVWAIWEVPRPDSGKAGRIRRALGTLFFSEGLQIESGRYFDVVVGSDANHDGNPLTDRPLNVGRNTFLGQRLVQLDASGGANIGLTENQRLRLSAQIFNVLNHTNFATYNTVLGQADLSGLDSRIVSGRLGVEGYDFRRPLTSSGFGLGTSTFGPRRIQLEVRYQF